VHAELIAQPAVVLLSLLVLGLKDRERLNERALCVALDVEMALFVLLAAAAVAQVVASRRHTDSVRRGRDGTPPTSRASRRTAPHGCHTVGSQ
jgi:hypothetical protein